MSETNPLRIAAVSDIHYTKSSKGALQDLFVEASSFASSGESFKPVDHEKAGRPAALLADSRYG